MKKNKIHIISTNRADFGLIKNLILELKKNKKFITKFIISGDHIQNNISDSILFFFPDKFSRNNIISFRTQERDSLMFFQKTKI